ncbi:class I adenylate-forming enzyme family protein [Pseudonocardia humida]|uniref:AMP-binding protein n=1 Tax=Pseudonocardia humida TaxID=2800819 RepID=A0ABT0ZXY4_9PSEU|nr:AMP-binding protein [Pseudonocardia humida]MCO1655581.1 AMP-binding protein [Pseudonocardia humida]
MPTDVPPPDPDVLTLYATATPDKPAVIDPGESPGTPASSLTFAELEARANRLANGLLGLGLGTGDRVVWCGPNGVEVLVLVHAARKAGLVAVPLAYRFTAEEMRFVIADSGAAVVLVDAEQADRVAAVRADLPAVREVVVFRGEPFDGALAWDDVLAGGSDQPPPPPGDGGGSMIYTSGTTGKPKGALRTKADPTMMATLVATLRLQVGTEVHLTTGPLYHSGPLAWATLTHALGGTVVLMRRFDAARWLRLVREYRVTNTFTAPTPLKRVVALPDDELARADLSSMRSLVANAAPVPYALKQEIARKLGEGFLFEVYGSTELGVDAVLPPEEQLQRPGSCGRALPGVELRVVGPDGTPQPTGEPGELQVRSTSTFDGYHGREPVGEGWKSVGDVAHLDADGYLYIRDRGGDLIISAGVNIYPAEVEAVLHAHPDVLDAAVFGVPSEEWGETVHAVVVPRAGRELDLAALDAHVAEHLAGFKRPRSWQVRDELPRTEAGKLLKRVLRAEHVA